MGARHLDITDVMRVSDNSDPYSLGYWIPPYNKPYTYPPVKPVDQEETHKQMQKIFDRLKEPVKKPQLKVDVTDETVTLFISCLGYSKEYLTLTLTDRDFKVAGDLKETKDLRFVEPINVSYTFAANVDLEKITIKLENGILTVKAPKTQPIAKKLEIT